MTPPLMAFPAADGLVHLDIRSNIPTTQSGRARAASR